MLSLMTTLHNVNKYDILYMNLLDCAYVEERIFNNILFHDQYYLGSAANNYKDHIPKMFFRGVLQRVTGRKSLKC